MTETGYSQDIIEKVISFQGEDMLRAFSEHSQIEISGFGLLFVAKGKLKKRKERITKYLDGGGEKVESHLEQLKYLNTKCLV
jgi:nucleoid DNA-binding protein